MSQAKQKRCASGELVFIALVYPLVSTNRNFSFSSGSLPYAEGGILYFILAWLYTHASRLRCELQGIRRITVVKILNPAKGDMRRWRF